MTSFGTIRQDIRWQRQELVANSLEGVQVAVIGGTNGIGRSLTHTLVAKGAQVLVVGRSFRDECLPRIKFIRADLSSVKIARNLARDLPLESLELIVMTQGIFAGRERRTNAEGIELDLAVSYLSRLVLVREFAGRVGKAKASLGKKPRVFVMGFPGIGKLLANEAD